MSCQLWNIDLKRADKRTETPAFDGIQFNILQQMLMFEGLGS